MWCQTEEICLFNIYLLRNKRYKYLKYCPEYYSVEAILYLGAARSSPTVSDMECFSMWYSKSTCPTSLVTRKRSKYPLNNKHFHSTTRRIVVLLSSINTQKSIPNTWVRIVWLKQVSVKTKYQYVLCVVSLMWKRGYGSDKRIMIRTIWEAS